MGKNSERRVMAGSGAGGRLLWSIIISQNHKYLEDPKPCLNTLPGKPVEVIALQVGNPTTGGRQRQAACCIAFTGERV
jgi:hypothetical protein